MFRQILTGITVISLLLFLTACTNGNRVTESVYLVTTTGMIGDAVKNVVKDKLKVESLMGPGVDPHLYKASHGDLSKLNSADIVFYNGLYLEGKMEDVLEKLSRTKKVVALGEHVDKSGLIQVSHGNDGKVSYDPHIWFDIDLWITALEPILQAVIEIDPANAKFYQENYNQHITELTDLNNWVKENILLIPKQQRILITSHDAFHYFGQKYGLQVEALIGISTAADFGLQDVSMLVNKIVKNKIKAVFVESSVSDRSLKAVIQGCGERGNEVKIGGTLFSDAMGDEGTPEGTYIGMVQHNVNTIVSALK